MSNKPTIAVLGALGGQGSSVVTSFLKEGSYQIRGVTRNPTSDSAKALTEKGVEMMAGDVKDPQSLTNAFTGADVAFIVVNFWDPEIMTKEGDITQEIFKVAKEAGVKHIIYSSLANVKQVTNGTINVPHFTLKAEAWEFLKTLNFETITAVEPPYYYSNWFTFFKPVEQEDGSLVWTWPGKGQPVSQFDVHTGTGPAVLVAAKSPMDYNGKHILLQAELLTPEQIVEQICAKLGKKGSVTYADPAEFSKLFPGAEELAEMIRWFDEYGYYGPETEDRKHDSGKKVDPGLLSFKDWLDTDAYKPLMSSSS